MAEEVTKAPKAPEPKPGCRIFLPEKTAKPDGFEDIGLTKEVSLKITGTVTNVNSNEWDKSVSLTLEITALSVAASDGKDITLAGAIKGAEKRV